jgi:hypothetical protein
MMVSGELDFDDRMYNDDTEAYYKVAYVIYILFGVIMTIFVTNLLIGKKHCSFKEENDKKRGFE